MTESVVIAGSLAQKPEQGGHTWQFLQYLLGFRRLGWKVTFIDRLEPEMCSDRLGRWSGPGRSLQLKYFLNVMREFGLEDDFCLIYDGGAEHVGIDRARLLERVRGANLMVNVMGFLTDREILDAARLRVFLDTDPGFGQMWQDMGLATMFTGHDRYVTIAGNMGNSDCAIPTLGISWIRWRQPIVLDQWPVRHSESTVLTGIGSWRGPYDPVTYRGRDYGLRVHEFRKFLEVPRSTDCRFQMALDIDPGETRDLQALGRHGWELVDPSLVASDPFRYRSFIQASMAEFSPVKGMYVSTRSGWFSERSVCYLASGKPVVVQDTGLGELLPLGAGLLAFSTLDDAISAVHAVSADYDFHAEAARTLAEDYFDSDRVLAELLEKVAA